MDELNDFFDFSKPFKRVTVPCGQVRGRVSSVSSHQIYKIEKRENLGKDYAKSYIEAERLQMLNSGNNSNLHEVSKMESLDELDDYEVGPEDVKNDDQIYQKYNIECNIHSELPIYESRTEILKTIRENSCVVLQGDTGCGKTTQVPQYILEDAFERKQYCNIICTQPRRIAAISIADRVCKEKNWQIGSLVGYQVGLHTNASDDTRLLYCTTGVLLQKLIKLKTMSQYTHIILDEVHERDQDMDFLLIIVRRFLSTISPNTKIILMSATINTTEFSDYFKMLKFGVLVPAPVINIDTKRLYTVKDFYLCELNQLKPSEDINYEVPGISDTMYRTALKLLVVCERLDEANHEQTDLSYKPSILIFLPGINEIDQMEKTMECLKDLNDISINVTPIRLHSLVSPEEQQKVFRKPPPNHRKVILSTNIAESSITVPDVKYVIDFCLTKYLVTDTSTNLTSLQLNWASRANCKQRAGRAGRVMDGRVYRLVPKHFYNNYMDEHGTPEMTRCPLENIVLKAKLLDLGPPHAILGLALAPPNLSDIRNTILILKESGALLKTLNKKYNVFDGDLTFIGRVMAALPININISRLIIFGYLYSVLEETIIIAAGLNVKSIFDAPYQNQLLAYSQKLTWSDGSGSDLFAILKAYRVWVSMKEQNFFKNDESEANWARRYYINTRSMKEMNLLVLEIKERLKKIGIREATGYDRINWLEHEKVIVLKVVIAGAFYPNYFVRKSTDPMEQERHRFHTLCGNDPCNTVYFSNFDSKYIGQLYTQSIKNIFDSAMISSKNIDVKFEPGTQKIFVTFRHDPVADNNNKNNTVLVVPGRVRPEVYKALKMRQLRLKTTINVLNPANAVTYAEAKGLGEMREGKWIPNCHHVENVDLLVTPTLFTKEVRGKITHIVHCGKFWFQPLSEIESLKNINAQINNGNINKFKNPSEISRGMLVAARFQENYHRAKVLHLEVKTKQLVSFRVLFIDYGNSEIIDFANLCEINPEQRNALIPARVFECCLAGIQPSSITCPSGRWPIKAMESMQTVADKGMNNGCVELEIYSVVNGITSVIMKAGDTTMNEMLVDQGFAQFTEENYMSKADHDLRMRNQSYSKYENKAALCENYLRTLQSRKEVVLDTPPTENCHIRLNLGGPHSPLESKVNACIRIGEWKTVNIEMESVNSVLLDTDPQDKHERLLVATNISQNLTKGSLIARSTTLMPNIHGFAALMGLIFCPTMEVRRDKHKTKYVSILAGLGCDDQNKPLFEEHDIVFNLDVELSAKDLDTINQIRYSMDTLLATDPGEEFPKITQKNRVEITSQIKNLLIKLLEKRRKYIEVHYDNKENIWNQIDREDLLEQVNVYGENAIFPFHSGMRLHTESAEYIYYMKLHCQELHNYRQTSIPVPLSFKCKLCDQGLENIVQLRIHLLSQLHRDREYQIGFTN